MQQEVIKGFRLSPQQRLLWSLLQENSPAYRAQCAILLEGSLRAEVLQEAVQKIVERHEILRTTFNRLPGMKLPVQVVAEMGQPLWRRIDQGSGDEHSPAIAELLAEERNAGFDVERGPLMRCTLVCLSTDRHLLIVTLPSLCSDTRSLQNIFEEIARDYQSGMKGDAQPAETVQYIQFSEWQNELLETVDEGDAGREFWHSQSEQAAPALLLPLENSPSAVPSFEPHVWTEAISPEVLSRINAVAEKQAVAPEVLLLACWQTLLWRLTGEQNVVVQLRCDGRAYEEMKEGLGLYETWPPVRCFFAENFRCDEILAALDKTWKETQEWQEYFSGEEFASEGVSKIGFSVEEWPAAQEAGGIRFSLINQYACTERFKLKLSCQQTPFGLNLLIHFDPAFYRLELIEILAHQYTTLLDSILTKTDIRLGELDVLSDEERHQILSEWNRTAIEFPASPCLPQMFEAQVERTPDAIALIFEDQRLTYSQLNQRANQLAHCLRRRGVAPEIPVALCVDRSPDMLVALLAIWKAGGVYLPLDPLQPKVRLAYMIENAQAQMVITQEALKPLLPEQHTELIFLDSDREQMARESEANPAVNLLPSHLAYIIYTSGSTGQPKGAMIEHASLLNLTHALSERIYKDVRAATLRVSLNAPLAFDSSIKQIVQVAQGRALCIVPEDVRKDGDALLEYVERHGLDVLDCTPSQLRMVLEGGTSETKREERAMTVLVGGEAIDDEMWQKMRASERTSYYNVYGPTECTVDATACLVEKEMGRAVIGRPLGNVQTYVLDQKMRAVALGVAGELCIGGAGVGRGYVWNPEQTAQRFIPNPYGMEPGARMYRTGDLARYRLDGNLEFLGRIDHQVKIRGSRIELGEIEATLSTHPSVRAAALLVREDTPGDKRLAAYLVARQPVPSTSELHAFLRERLPEYMMPSAFVMLDSLPLTPNGKVDRQALPAPDQLRPELEEAYVAPRNTVEELLAGIWAQLLGVERVGVMDNFFELGGHSLLATQIISQMRQAFKVEIPLRNIFEMPTIAALSVSVEKALKAAAGVQVAPIERVSRDERLPLSFAQQRLWLLDQIDSGTTAYHVPYAIGLRGTLDIKALERSLTEIVRRHEVLRTTFALAGGHPAQFIEPPMPFELNVTDLLELEEPEREAQKARLMNEEAQRPFDLEQGPLVRARLLRADEREHVLVFVMHHIVFDAWSIGVLLQEVATLYQAFSLGQPSPLAELPIQYADFAHWQRTWMQGETLEEHLAYWRAQLAEHTTLELPTDRPRPPAQTFNGAHQTFTLDGSLVQSLYELSRREGVTLFMTLLAAFQTLLHRYTGQEDIILGTPIANRNYLEIEGLIGFFINTLVLRTDLSGEPNFKELLKRVREVALGAYAHQDLPFEKLVEELHPNRDLSRTPFFQVLFTVRKLESGSVNLPDLTLHGLDLETGTAKFDLLMLVNESEEEISFGFEYNTDLFDARTIARMGAHFQNLLAGIVAAPDEQLLRLPMLTDEERTRLLFEWNDTGRPYPQHECVHQMFEAQVRRTPDAVALIFEDRQLTYSELDQRANRLAHYLRGMGVGPDVFVGILMHRSVEMMVAVLGIMKACGAYIGLDPSHPPDRLAYMLEDTGARLVLTQGHIMGHLPPLEIKAVPLDTDWQEVAAMSLENVPCEASADNLVYATYTSGSTGKPKGIAMPHRSVRNLLEWQVTETHLPQGARTLQFASLSFDVSFQDIFSTWGMGGTLVMITEETRRDIARLSGVLVEKEISRLFIPAVALQQLAEGFCAQEQITASLRKIIAGSEQLQITRAIARLFTELKDCTLHNEYGPSEAHVVTELALPAFISDWPDRPSVGRPIFNTQIFILDRNMQPVPVGVSGELLIGGAGLARCYLNRPEITADKFIPNPFSREGGARLYRTGDLARRLADGQIEFLGRMDFQVKIRGYRVELGEIEAVLGGHPAVSETIVLAREDSPGNKRLVAYLVLAQEHAPTVSELRIFLQRTLPEYMVPSAFVFMDTLPLTPNGKVNRRALPVPDQSRPELEREFVAPRTALEDVIADCWAEVLMLERVGVMDNFFELGGHSLLATQIIGRLRELFNVELPIRTLFEAPTVAGIAGKMTQDADGALTLENIAQTLKELAELSEGEVDAMLESERLAAETGAE